MEIRQVTKDPLIVPPQKPPESRISGLDSSWEEANYILTLKS